MIDEENGGGDVTRRSIEPTGAGGRSDTAATVQEGMEAIIELEAVRQIGGDPADPDGDGLYEDVDGDGTVSYNDVVTLFERFDEFDTDDLRSRFDFNENGRLDFDDVVTFFEEEDFGGSSPTGTYAWLGVSPDEIDGETNPTLSLTAGRDYTVEWTNRTGEAHNFVVANGDGDELVSSSTMNQEGGTQTVEFTATEEMATYYSDSHASEMRGTVEVTPADDGQPAWNRDLDVPIDGEEATNWDNYEVTNVFPTGTIASEYDLQDGEEGEWMQMAVDPQDRVWVITRGAPFVTEGDGYAEVAWVDPNTGEHQLALELPVSFHGGHIAEPHFAGSTSPARELGGQGIAFDPNFEENGYVYLMYHPSSENLEEVENPYHDEIFYANTLVSRFEIREDGTLDPASEQVVFKVPEQYNTCCHHGCYITFGEGREFYISTGDNSNNVGNPDNLVNWFMGDERQGIVHGRPGPVADAQRTSGNTADKRGKIHRIILNEDGSYDIPEGNLKEHWENETGESYSDEEFLPEIYVMGLRNPFTITYDDHTGYLWTAHYGNDGDAINELGMPGFGDYHLWCGPGNAGYPWFRAYYPYRDYDFETGEVGQPFWPDNLRNDSPNNTGITDVPNVTPALLWHPQTFTNYENATEIHPWLDQPRPGEVTWPAFEPGGSADVGVVYRYSEEYGEGALDPFFDGKAFIMRPSNSDITRFVTFDEDGSIELTEFPPGSNIGAAYDMKVLSDGRLVIMGMYSGIHLVEYQGSPPDSQPPPRVEPGAEGLSGDPPGDATVLWNGEDATLEGWQQPNGDPAQWTETDGYFEVVPGSGNVQPDQALGDVHLHLEWRVPERLDGIQNGQGPGNSGIFMMDTYEFQILQSHDNPTYPSGHAGSYYKATEGGGSAPLALPIRPPGEWNTYDMFWRAPVFENGEVVRLPQATLFFNGVAVQMHLNLPGPVWFDTLYPFDHDQYGHPRDENGNFLEEVPFTLQDHGGENDVVQFRNVWYRNLPEDPVDESEHPDQIPTYSTSGGNWNDPEQITPGGTGTTGEPPEDADVLFDDAITLRPGEGDWVSDTAYGDAQIHVEYRIPEDVEGEGPLRGASGVLMMGEYEINIVDTWDNPVDADEWAGAYTYQAPPHHDAVREPGEWQQLDILWQSPRFVDGELDKPAQVSAFLNGVAVQTRLVVDGPNDHHRITEYNEHAELPLRLEEAGSEIDFRNAWIREEEAELVGEEPEPTEPQLVGHYDASTLSLDDGAAVSTWSAVEDAGPDLTQSDSAAQPTFQTDSANGNPTVRFEGDGDFINADSVVTEDTAGVTMAATFRTSDPTVPRQAVMYNGSDGDGNGYGVFVNDEEGAGPASDGYVSALYGGVNWWWSDTTATQDQFHVVTLTIPEDSPNQPVLRLDGQELSTESQNGSPGSPATPSTQFGIGYDDGLVGDRPPYFAGDIGEVRVYNGELSEDDRAQLEREIGNKWGADVPEPDLSTGLVGHWSFEAGNIDGDTVLDRSGNGHDGTIMGGVTTGLDSPVEGGAAEFDGQEGSTVLVPDDGDALDPAAYTVSTWIQTDATGFYSAPLGKSGSMWAGFLEDTGNPRFDPDDNSSNGVVVADTGVADGEWHHLVYRHAPGEGTSSIYIDGEMVASTDGAVESPDSGSDLGIGSKSNEADWISALLADVRLYNRPLSESAITTLYEQADGSGGGGSGAIDPSTTITLEGFTSGWEGAAPSSIAGTTNPTLRLREGEEYTVEWTSADGAAHDFDVETGDGTVVVDTNTISGEGTTETVSFTVGSDMAEYFCSLHPNMRGSIEVVSGSN